MKQTRTGNIACSVHGCQRIATRKYMMPRRSYGQPYPYYCCQFHAQHAESQGAHEYQLSITGFAVVGRDFADKFFF